MLCALRRPSLWSLDLFIHLQFQLPIISYITATISALETFHTQLTFDSSTGYSFTPESSEAREGKVPSSKALHRDNDVPALRGGEHYIPLKILHQAGI